MPRREVTERVENLSPLPLRQFKKGQTLYFKFTLSPGFSGWSQAEFQGIERGLVVLKPVTGTQTPSHLDDRSFERMFPGGTTKVRPTSCYLWGKGPGDMHPHCCWFHTLDDPVREHSGTPPLLKGSKVPVRELRDVFADDDPLKELIDTGQMTGRLLT